MTDSRTPNALTLSQAADAIACGELASEDLVRACLGRIAAREPQVRAFAHVAGEAALAAARDADKARLLGDGPRGPLHGVPVAVKDVIDTADMPTQHNSRIYAGHRPARDAAAVALLRAAGAIILGKADTIEFAAHGRMAMTRNPHDLGRTPGGSSSGSAAAVADLMVPAALGTQTGGSMIRPGSFCGVLAFKPTWATLSPEGAKLFSVSLDTIGWYARSVADITLLAEVFEIADAPVPAPPPVRSLRLGVCRTPYWDRASPAMQRAFAAAVQRLHAAGATIVDAELGPDFAAINDLKEIVMRTEGRAAFLDLWKSHPTLVSPGIRARMERTSDRRLRDAQDAAALLRIGFDRMADALDAVLTPAAPGIAPEGIAQAGDPIFNGLWTLLHTPCLSLPVLQGENGLPMGLQLVGARYGDARLLAAAETVTSVLAD